MANCIAKAIGQDSGRIKEAHSTGRRAATAMAATWETEAVAHIRKDGSGYVEVRNLIVQKSFHRFEFGPESERTQKDAVQKALDGEL